MVAIIFVGAANVAFASNAVPGLLNCFGSSKARIQIQANTSVLSKSQLLDVLRLTSEGNVDQYLPPLFDGTTLTMYLNPDGSYLFNKNFVDSGDATWPSESELRNAVATTLEPIIEMSGVSIECQWGTHEYNLGHFKMGR